MRTQNCLRLHFTGAGAQARPRGRWLAIGAVVAACWGGGGGAVSAWGSAILNLGAGVMNPPAPVVSVRSQAAIPDVAKVVDVSAFGGTLGAVFAAQGFTPAHNWIYSLANQDVPSGLVNPVVFSGTGTAATQINLTTYNPILNSVKSAFGETIRFTMTNPAPDPVLEGATITRHWLQFVNTAAPVNGYGFALPGLGGFWQLDNGQLSWANSGTGPFYDSNAAPGAYSTPYSFYDQPAYYAGVGTYLHFTVLPTWDVNYGGKDYLIIGDTGLTWGFTVVPEPAAWGLGGVGFVGLLVRRVRR